VFYRFDRLLAIAGHFVSQLLALAIVATAWGTLAIGSISAGVFAAAAMVMFNNNAALLVIAFFIGSVSVGLFFSVYVWGPYIGPAVFGVLKAVTDRP
jgi:hypothetical protein